MHQGDWKRNRTNNVNLLLEYEIINIEREKKEKSEKAESFNMLLYSTFQSYALWNQLVYLTDCQYNILKATNSEQKLC